MLSLLFSRGGGLLAVISFLASTVVAETFEKLSGVPDGWRYSHTPNTNQQVRLQIALQQQNVTGFEKTLRDMSTPGHPNYGKHFQSHDEMKKMLLPSDAAVSAVRGWLKSNGISDIQQDADWINFWTTVGVANSLLDTKFQWYVNDGDQSTVLRTLEYSVPESVARHINMVQPTTRFGGNRATLRRVSDKQGGNGALRAAATSGPPSIADCYDGVNPRCLKALYKIGEYEADPKSGSTIGFASFLEQYARYSDLDLFEKNIAPYAAGQNFSVVTFNGGLNDQNSASSSGEANLDLQYIIGVSSPVPVTEFSTGGRGPLIPDLSQPNLPGNNEPYLEFLQNLLKMNQSDIPKVISVSYGEDEQSVPSSYAYSVCNLLAQLASRGVSVIFSSGDSGVGNGCQTNNGSSKPHFLPQFPATCPWVTAVGATHYTSPEYAAYFSSGGFSDLWPRPEYQDSAVNQYLGQIGTTFNGLFNASGRAFPDVSAQGMNFEVYDKGVLGQFYGTSCAAPVFSAIVSLLNDARLRNNQSTLGFLNPWLYGAGRSGLNDITDGSSTGCRSSNGGPSIPYASWNATQGWDPVTGLGTPDFSKLKDIALSL